MTAPDSETQASDSGLGAPSPQPSGAPAPRAHGAYSDGKALLAVALVLGLLRFVRLGEWSLWFDEVATWTDVHHGLAGGQINNPLGYWAISGVARLFGEPPDELSLRLAPALVGWAVVPLTWWVFRPLFGGRVAAAAALLVSVSTWQVGWSQTARFYTMAQAVSLAGSGLVLQGYARGSVTRTILGLVVATASFFFHPSGLLMVPALVAAPWFVSLVGVPFREARKPAYALLACSIVAVVLAFPMALETWNWYAMQKGHKGGLLERLPWVLHYVKTTGFYVTPVVGIAALIGAWFAWRRGSAMQVCAVGVAFLGLFAALVASAFVRISAQYVFVALPWLCLLAVLPLAREPAGDVPDELRVPAPLLGRLRAAWVLVLVVPALVSTGLYLTVRRGERPAWRDAYQYVWNERGPGDLVLGMEASVGEFYIAPNETALRETRHVAWLDKFRALRPERWARHPRRTWYVINPEQLVGWKPEEAEALRRHLREECRLVKSFPLYVESRDLSVWVFVRT